MIIVCACTSLTFLPRTLVQFARLTSATLCVVCCLPQDHEGKRNDWEAVVLVPFIDERRLLDAVATLDASRCASEAGPPSVPLCLCSNLQ